MLNDARSTGNISETMRRKGVFKGEWCGTCADLLLLRVLMVATMPRQASQQQHRAEHRAPRCDPALAVAARAPAGPGAGTAETRATMLMWSLDQT